MKVAQLIHNPEAGDEEHSKAALLKAIRAGGFTCHYSSTEDADWQEFGQDVDFLIVAGGDGTVRQLTRSLLTGDRSRRKLPIALLPLGTANNISKTLGIEGEIDQLVSGWKTPKIKSFDIGKIEHIEKSTFFLESFGFGLFPYLMQEMEKVDESETDTPEKKLQKALEVLHLITDSYQPKDCSLFINQEDHSGKLLMLEVMNTQSIGPNLLLSPNSNPYDGELEVVLLPEQDRQKFSAYIAGKIEGNEENYFFQTIKAKEVKITWEGTHVHTDDEVLKIDARSEVEINVATGLLQFMLP